MTLPGEKSYHPYSYLSLRNGHEFGSQSLALSQGSFQGVYVSDMGDHPSFCQDDAWDFFNINENSIGGW